MTLVRSGPAESKQFQSGKLEDTSRLAPWGFSFYKIIRELSREHRDCVGSLDNKEWRLGSKRFPVLPNMKENIQPFCNEGCSFLFYASSLGGLVAFPLFLHFFYGVLTK